MRLIIPALFLVACSSTTEPTREFDATTDFGDSGISDVGIDQANDLDSGSDPRLAPLFEPGTEVVGYRELSVTYDAPGTDIDRELPLKVWYPADPATDASAITYKVGGLVNLPSELALDAPAPASGEFPLLVYSHGSGGEGLLAYPYAEHFASHGWIVIAPNHVGNTALDALGNTLISFGEIALYRVLDITAVIDAMETGPDPELAGLADLDRIFLFGHSFGAYTTIASAGADVDIDAFIDNCATFGQPTCDFLADPEVDAAFRAGFGDPRIDAIAPQAPAVNRLMAPGALATIDVPMLLASGRRDQTTQHFVEAQPAWDQTDGADDIWLDFQNAGHFSFISVCYDLPMALVDQFSPGNQEDGCGEDFTPALEVVETNRAYLFAFAALHVLGDDTWSDLLAPPSLVGESLLLFRR